MIPPLAIELFHLNLSLPTKLLLQVLRLDNNELTSLPTEIGKLINLEQLTISSNKLKSLPDNLGDLKSLQHLDLRSNNQLCILPATIYKNKRLASLLLDDNRDWIEPPTSIVKHSIPAIFAYFAQSEDECLMITFCYRGYLLETFNVHFWF